MSQLRILMATDVPFWKSRTGAQQRILRLVKALSKQTTPAINIKTFYVGPAENTDHAQANSLSLDVDFRSSDQRPTGIAHTLKWRFDGTVNLAKQKLNRSNSDSDLKPVTLDDFRWPWAITAFKGTVKSFQPHVILNQYLTMSYLLESLSKQQRDLIHCMVDTHDVLSDRRQQFKQFGYSHWIDIDETEESKTLQRYDSIIAIHESERAVFAKMAPQAKVIVAGHSVERLDSTSVPSEPLADRSLTIGYLGSSNDSNLHALKEFLEKAWPALEMSKTEFVIAGGICESLENVSTTKIKVLGEIDNLDEFYGEVDIVVNPVSFGTGLKIKSCEALGFGKPSLVTKSGFDAMPSESQPATVIVESVAAMADALKKLSDNRSGLLKLQNSATEISKLLFNDETVYRELMERLREVEK